MSKGIVKLSKDKDKTDVTLCKGLNKGRICRKSKIDTKTGTGADKR